MRTLGTKLCIEKTCRRQPPPSTSRRATFAWRAGPAGSFPKLRPWRPLASYATTRHSPTGNTGRTCHGSCRSCLGSRLLGPHSLDQGCQSVSSRHGVRTRCHCRGCVSAMPVIPGGCVPTTGPTGLWDRPRKRRKRLGMPAGLQHIELPKLAAAALAGAWLGKPLGD